MEIHPPPSFSKSTVHGDSCPGPPTIVPLPKKSEGGSNRHSSFPLKQLCLGRRAQGSVWRGQAADGQRQHVSRRQEAAPGAGFRAQHWQPCTSWRLGARCQGWLAQSLLGKGWTGAFQEEESLPASGASRGVPSTWASLIPTLPHP